MQIGSLEWWLSTVGGTLTGMLLAVLLVVAWAWLKARR
jgi:hypothetical protein